MLHETLQRGLGVLDRFPVGRRFDPAREQIGLLQRWYAAQPTQRIIVAIIELAQAPDDPALESALRALCMNHPHALGMCLARSTSELSMRPLTPQDAAPLYVPREPIHDAWQLAEHIVHVPFEPGGPLFRVARVGKSRRLVCAFDHIMFDGISAAQLACALARSLAGTQPTAAEPDAYLPLDARLDLRPSAAQIVKALRPRPTPALPLFAREPAALRTQISRCEIDSTDIERLRTRAHQSNVTLHAALSAFALLAAAEALGIQEGSLRLHTPVSLRSRCRPEPRGFGVYIAGVDSDLEVSPLTDPWQLARRYADDLARDKPNAPGQLGLLALAGDLRERARELEKQQHGRTAALEVSNVGRMLDVPHDTAIWLSQGAHYHAPLLVLTVLESAGVVRACLSTPHPLVAPEQASRFIQAFVERLAAVK
ncbi:MAG TPA: hypothetical protein VMF89_35825 [Polyangiales bacterium]|nr:hypothetical protein [Polyangiales bacterium]